MTADRFVVGREHCLAYLLVLLGFGCGTACGESSASPSREIAPGQVLTHGAVDGQRLDGTTLGGESAPCELAHQAEYVLAMQRASLGRLLSDRRWGVAEQRPYLALAVRQTVEQIASGKTAVERQSRLCGCDPAALASHAGHDGYVGDDVAMELAFAVK